MELMETKLKGLYVIKHKKLEDDRGFFTRTYCKNIFKEISFEKNFVQFNHSFNKEKGTLRGMHFQTKPFKEVKLIRCVQGAVYDVAIDLRVDSDTYLESFGIELSQDNFLSVLIPEGFAHGFQTLKDSSSLIYHHTEFYRPGADSGVKFDDPSLKLDWPLPVRNVSVKDSNYELIDINFKGL
jgi:dTDP-4-dehydrorhamnose 3,5-epimerase